MAKKKTIATKKKLDFSDSDDEPKARPKLGAAYKPGGAKKPDPPAAKVEETKKVEPPRLPSTSQRPPSMNQRAPSTNQ